MGQFNSTVGYLLSWKKNTALYSEFATVSKSVYVDFGAIGVFGDTVSHLPFL